MAQDNFIPLVGDDWYQRRRDDTEGRFFRQVADQGPKKGGGATRQGVYCFTASGKLLAYGNHADPQVMRKMIQRGLKEWNQMPASERRPGAVQVDPPPKSDLRYTRQPPPEGLILNVYTRILDRDARGELCNAICKTVGGDRTARDHMWWTKRDWQSLIPADLRKDTIFALPEPISDRLIRFHLVDNTRGEPPSWRLEDIRSRKLTLIVEEVTDKEVCLRLEGTVHLATDANESRADRGFEVRLLGSLRYDRQRETFDRVDLLAIGEHWGEGPFTKGARPGRSMLGIVFELATSKRAGDRVPPQGAREIDDYLGH